MLKKKITIEYLAGMMKGEFDRMDKRFESVDKRFESMDKRFESVATKDDLVNLMGIVATQDDIKAIKERLDKLEASVRNLTDTVDKFAKIITDYHQEQLFMGERLKRHEEWIKIIAGKVGVELKV